MKTTLVLFFFFCLASFSLKPKPSSKVRTLPPGVTYVTSPIVLHSGESLIGDNSILKLADGANCPILVIGDITPDPQFLTENVYVSSVSIDGNMDNQHFEGYLGNPEDSKKHSVRNNGITVRHAKNVVIEDVVISNCRSGGIVIERGSSDINILNSTSAGNFFDGLAAYESTRIFCYNLNLINNKYAGFSGDLQLNGNVIMNSAITGNGREGIFIRHANDNVFDRIRFSNNGGFPIFVAASELSDSAAKRNVFTDCFFFTRGGEIQINDPEVCVDNLVVNPRYSSEALVGFSK